ncbi:hypothetical protein C8R43DRAFT_117772 [Mycena crocata]|nr:hypothetical protein C8R43DRAFT_117772 [Mycena crocata]
MALLRIVLCKGDQVPLWVLLAFSFAELKRALSRRITFNGYPQTWAAVSKLQSTMRKAASQVEAQACLYFKTLHDNYPEFAQSHLPLSVLLLAAVGPWFMLGYANAREAGDLHARLERWKALAPTAVIDDAVDGDEVQEDEENPQIGTGMTFDRNLQIPKATFHWLPQMYFIKEDEAWERLKEAQRFLEENVLRFYTREEDDSFEGAFIVRL